MDEENSKAFTALDFGLFSVMLLIPASIGIYFAWRDRSKNSTNNYYYGEKRMHPVAVGLSTAATGISAITLIGYPAEVYIVGSVYLWAPIVIILVAIVTILYYVPFYSRLQLHTVFEYLELRFNPTARKLCSVMVPVSEIIYMGTIIYLPSLALSAVTPISVTWGIVFTSVVCTFYTTLGGMKAVIWTDVLQASLMISAALGVLIKGVADLGFEKILKDLENGDRMTFFRPDFNFASRKSQLAISIGEFFLFSYYICFWQPVVQRIQSCRNCKQSQLSIVSYIIPAIIIILQSIFNGFLMYSYFAGCDPVKSRQIGRLDQGMPYMAIKLFRKVPGMIGFFVAAVFSGTLSTVSSGINSYSIVILENIFGKRYTKISEKRKLLAGKGIGLLLGSLVFGVAYSVSVFDSNVYKIVRSLVGAVSGPVLGMFTLGIFFPWANAWVIAFTWFSNLSELSV